MSESRDIKEIMKRLEQIIALFKRHPDGLTTGELYRLMRDEYHYSQTIENLRKTYLGLLEENVLRGVQFQRSMRGRHTLKDTRFTGTALDRENRAYIKLALETVENLEDISKVHPDVCQKLALDNLQIPFYIKAEEWQKLDTEDEEVEALEEAVLNRNIILFDYEGGYYHVEPYRLVNFEGIWYLYGRDIEEHTDNDHKTWLLEHIENVEIDHTRKHDVTEAQIEEILEEAEHPLFNPEVRLDVELLVTDSAAKIVKLKAFFPRQEILSEGPEGLHLRSTVSTYAEVLDEIKMLLPHVRILSPHVLRERLEKELQSWLEDGKKHKP